MTAAGRPAEDDEPAPPAPRLLRSLGALDGALITIGATVGSGIFLTTGDIAQRSPQPALILGLWAVGGLFALAGALAYAELGTMFPRAGGQYHFLKEAYGRLWGFLFGWTSFLVIMTGGIAAIAVGFGEYLGAFVPALGSDARFLSVTVAGVQWTVRGPQLSGAAAIVGLTAVNWLGVREGALVQNLATALKIGALLVLVALGLAVPPQAIPAWGAPLPPGSVVAGLGLGLVAVLWAYDGWYVLTFSAGEIRAPARNLPRGLVLGVAVVAALYLGINWVYLRALDVPTLAQTSRVGEAAAAALLGPGATRAVTVVILLAMFGCLAANILCCARVYLPMAEDGVFFRGLARIHPSQPHAHRKPAGPRGPGGGARALRDLCRALHHGGVRRGALPRRDRRRRLRAPEDPSRRRAALSRLGTPVEHRRVRGRILTVASVTLFQAPVRSLLGLALIAAGLPAYAWWSRSAPRPG